MELQKQQLLIEYLLTSHTLFVKVNPILKAGYWDPKLRNTVKFIQSYFDTYKIPPTPDQVRAETSQSLSLRPSMTQQELQYAEHQLESFCRNKAIEHAILSSPALLEQEKFGEIEKLIRDAITVGLSRNVGLDYFADPEQRL